MTKVKKSDEEILFPNVKVGIYTIKPWSFGLLFEIVLLLDEIICKMEERKIVLDFSKEGIPYEKLLKIFSLASSQILKVIAISLDVPEQEVKDFDIKEGMEIAMTIYKQNEEQIKNALTPLLMSSEGEKKV